MMRYWLGELSPEAELRLEERSSDSEELFEQLLAVKEELTDAYVRGELAAEQRARFKRRLLQLPADQARLEFSQTLVSELDSQVTAAARVTASSSPQWWSWPRLAWALGCAGLLLALGGLIRDNLRLRAELARSSTAQLAQQQRTRELEAQLAQTQTVTPTPPSVTPPEKPAAPGGTLAITLSALSLRSGGGATIQLKPETHTLHCNLLLDTPDLLRRYQVVLTQNGRDLRRWQGLRPMRNAVTVELSTAQLSAGEYSFELRRINEDGSFENTGRYTFHLVKP